MSRSCTAPYHALGLRGIIIVAFGLELLIAALVVVITLLSLLGLLLGGLLGSTCRCGAAELDFRSQIFILNKSRHYTTVR